MMKPLRIIVADNDAEMVHSFESLVSSLGHQVVCTASNGIQLVERCGESKPDLVIAEASIRELDGVEAANALYARFRVPVVLVAREASAEWIRRAEESHVMALLAKPVKEADLAAAIALAVRRFEGFESLRKETLDLKQALEDRKLIERAKGILMKKAQLDEPDAFHRLQQLSRDNNKKLAEVARTIVLAEQAFRPAERAK